MRSRYVYPAIVEWIEEDGVFDIAFPDLEECFTFAENDEDIMQSAKEVLELCIYDREENNGDIPAATKISDLDVRKGQSILMVDVWMIPVRDKFENKSVKKTLTIPKWLNDIAEEQKVNFSHILQSSLKDYLGLNK